MNRKQIVITATVVAILCFLAYLQFRTWQDFDWKIFFAATRRANPLMFLLAIGLIYTTYFWRALRWKLLQKRSKGLRIMDLFNSMVIGFTGVAVLGRPGDLIRPYLIARRNQLPFSGQVGVLAVERVFDMGSVALILAIDLIFAPSLHGLRFFKQFQIAGAMLVATVVGLGAVMFLIWKHGPTVAEWTERVLSRLPAHTAAKVASRIREFGDGLHTIHGLPSFIALTALSVMVWLTIAGAYLATVHAFPDPALRQMTISHVSLLMSASIAGSMLQLPVVGGGSQLGTIAMLHYVFNIDHELAASCGITLWLVTFISVVPLGLALARHEHVSLTRLSEASHEPEAAAGAGSPG